jgi:hypothetical protein
MCVRYAVRPLAVVFFSRLSSSPSNSGDHWDKPEWTTTSEPVRIGRKAALIVEDPLREHLSKSQQADQPMINCSV